MAETAEHPEIREFAERTYRHMKLEYDFYNKFLSEKDEKEIEKNIIMDEEPEFDYGYSLSELTEEELNKMLESYLVEMSELEEQLNIEGQLW